MKTIAMLVLLVATGCGLSERPLELGDCDGGMADAVGVDGAPDATPLPVCSSAPAPVCDGDPCAACAGHSPVCHQGAGGAACAFPCDACSPPAG